MQNIIDILDSYKSKTLDESAIEKLFNLIFENYNIKDEIKYELVSGTHRDLANLKGEYVLGDFDMYDTIYIYLDEIKKSIIKCKWLNEYLDEIYLSESDYKLIINLFILETIIHETIHGKQVLMVKDKNDSSLEKQILSYEYDFIDPMFDELDDFNCLNYIAYIKRKLLYERTYDISFMERMANYKSLTDIIDILKIYNNRLHYQYQKTLTDYLLSNYHHNLKGPTLKYLKKLGYLEDFKNTFKEETMSEEELFIYGLPIKKETYLKKKKTLKS